nr:MAG TPA: hypothetical protein [Caudoviricetes sp.]
MVRLRGIFILRSGGVEVIEIKCTKRDQDKIIRALEVMELPCLFPKAAKKCAITPGESCRKCLTTKIKWDIQ